MSMISATINSGGIKNHDGESAITTRPTGPGFRMNHSWPSKLRSSQNASIGIDVTVNNTSVQVAWLIEAITICLSNQSIAESET